MKKKKLTYRTGGFFNPLLVVLVSCYTSFFVVAKATISVSNADFGR